MSPTVTERIKVGWTTPRSFPHFPRDEEHDVDLMRAYRSPQTATRRIRSYGGHEHRQSRYVYFSVVHHDELQPVEIKMGGSQLPGITFETFDATGMDSRGLSLWATELALGVGSRTRGLFEVERGTTDQESITADFDHALDVTWLVSAFDAIFTPVTEEDSDLEFDPDDYPVV